MEAKNPKLQPQEKIEYSKPQLTDFSYGNLEVIAAESGCEEMRYSGGADRYE